MVAEHAAGKAGEDRCESGQPWPVHHFQIGRMGFWTPPRDDNRANRKIEAEKLNNDGALYWWHYNGNRVTWDILDKIAMNGRLLGKMRHYEPGRKASPTEIV